MAMAPTVSASVSFSARPSVPAVTVLRPPPRAVSVSASAGSGRARAGAPEGGKWWAPLVGWSGRADYIKAAAPASLAVVEEEGEEEEARIRSSSFVGGLTEAKARQLRARMVETESFHDAMYHSAIASRLARSA